MLGTHRLCGCHLGKRGRPRQSPKAGVGGAAPTRVGGRSPAGREARVA
jgi:hypothetical protein